MIEISPNVRVGDLASARPDLLGLLDQLRIDYCCHGDQTLAMACERAGLSAASVCTRLAAARSQPPERLDANASMTELCDEIVSTHHAFVRASFDRLNALKPRILAAHGARHPSLARLAQVIKTLEDDMNDHMIREERVLFPWLRRLEKPEAVTIGPPWSVRRPIDCMVHDHEVVAQALEEIRSLTSDFAVPEGGCGSMQSLMHSLLALDHDTRRHVHKENNILFPAGILAEQRRAGRAQPEGCSA